MRVAAFLHQKVFAMLLCVWNLNRQQELNHWRVDDCQINCNNARAPPRHERWGKHHHLAASPRFVSSSLVDLVVDQDRVSKRCRSWRCELHCRPPSLWSCLLRSDQLLLLLNPPWHQTKYSRLHEDLNSRPQGCAHSKRFRWCCFAYSSTLGYAIHTAT